MALPFTLKSIFRQKKNYGNSNISPCQHIIFKKSFKRNQKPSRYYNSIITNLKFQHKPKWSSFKNPHIKIDLLLLPTRGQNPLSYYNSINESKHNILALVGKADKLGSQTHSLALDIQIMERSSWVQCTKGLQPRLQESNQLGLCSTTQKKFDSYNLSFIQPCEIFSFIAKGLKFWY